MRRFLLIFSLILSLTFVVFTGTVFAEDTQPLFELKPSSTYYTEFPAGAFTAPLTVGKVWVDGVLANDFNFTVNWGANSVLFFRFVPCSYKFGPNTGELSFSDFMGYSVRFELPIYEYDGTSGAYGSTEIVELTIGELYSGYSLWTEDNVVYPGTVNFRRINSNSQLIFVIDARYITYGVTQYHGSYSNYGGLDLLRYICATLKYCETPLVGTSIDHQGNIINGSYVSTNFVFDINYFPGQLTWYEKEYLQKITELGTLLEDIDSIFKDIEPPPIVTPDLPSEDVTPNDPNIKVDEENILDYTGDVFSDFSQYQNYINSLMPNFTNNSYYVNNLANFSVLLSNCFNVIQSGTVIIYNNYVVYPFTSLIAFSSILILLRYFGFGGNL